jgi:hypothetical protein
MPEKRWRGVCGISGQQGEQIFLIHMSPFPSEYLKSQGVSGKATINHGKSHPVIIISLESPDELGSSAGEGGPAPR